MPTSYLLPEYPGLHMLDVSEIDDGLVFTVESTHPTAVCPLCQHISGKVHSQYARSVMDLPSADRKVQLHLNVRRFFCHNPVCQRVTFAERLGKAIVAYARRTTRLLEVLQKMALELSGEGAARLSKTLKMPSSGDSFLALLRKQAIPKFEEPQVVGIDDFAFRKGKTYGTIVVDLERHQPIELLPDRKAQTVADWLELHPHIEVVSRDRASSYAEAARRAAPQATQVADRWHLIKNISDYLKTFFDRKQLWKLKLPQPHPNSATSVEGITELTEGKIDSELNNSNLVDRITKERTTKSRPLARITRQEQISKVIREKRLKRYEEVIFLSKQGFSKRQLAQKTGLSRNTIRRYLRVGQFVEVVRSPQRRSKLKPYHSYLSHRFEQGVSNATLLWLEIKAKGFTGSVDTVRRFLLPLRTANDEHTNKTGSKPGKLASRQVSWWFTQPRDKLKVEEQDSLKWLLDQDEQYHKAYDLAQSFVEMVRNQQAEKYDSWIKSATKSKIMEMEGFARSLKSDEDAVLAGLKLQYSNGQVEGQNNRLKYLKRQRFGRAKFDLLRIQVLAS